MYYSEEGVFVFENQVSTLQSKTKMMRASGNDLLREKIALKEHNTVLTDMIANAYITQLRASASTYNQANIPPIATTSHREQKISDPPIFAGNRSKARAWIMDIRFKLTADTQHFRTKQAKMIGIKSRLDGPVKDKMHPFINNDLSFKFADANMLFSFLTSHYDDLDRLKSVVSALGNLQKRNRPFSDFMPEFSRLMNGVGYTDDQAKIDLLSVKLCDKMSQLLIGQDMPADYLDYVTRLHKLDTDAHVAGQEMWKID